MNSPDPLAVTTDTGAQASSVPVSTLRFAKKRQAILAAASHILNRHGVQGMTLANVAASVGLITTSVTYYFKKKDDLAVACFLDGIRRFDALMVEALREANPQARLWKFIDLCLGMYARIRTGEEPTIAVFNDIRALNKDDYDRVRNAYKPFFQNLRALFQGPGLEGFSSRDRTARAHMLTEQIFWSVAWLPRYDVEDYPRIRDRMFDILAHGVAAPGTQWKPAEPPPALLLASDAQEISRRTFLTAATRLINMHGYRGASVTKISAELKVTKGSFYHHNEDKDDLVVACFLRTFDVMRSVQRWAIENPGTQWQKLASTATALVDYQLSEQGPLLRTSALSALPATIRTAMVERSNRVSDRFASMISDGIAEGSLRAVDPFIAAQMMNATLNVSAELSWWVPNVQRDEAAALYARPMLMGVF